MEKVARKVCKTGRRMREIKDAHDLAKVWSDGSLINEKALDDPAVLKKLAPKEGKKVICHSL